MEKNHTPSDFEKKVLSNLTLPTALPKEEVWAQLQESMQTKSIRAYWHPLLQWTVAASLIAVFVGGFLRFYTTTINCPSGTYLAQVLPDGSQVYLNAGSRITYHPYWWEGNRTVELEGEAFFEVQKGSRFEVQSEQGKTEVLGTSFNVYARDQNYAVVCQTGKVLVTSPSKDSVYLLPTEKVILIKDKLQKQQQVQQLAWRQQFFSFENAPLQEVVEELERQYAIEITLLPALSNKYHYTGYFKKTKDPAKALEVITISLGIQFEKTAKKQYKILL